MNDTTRDQPLLYVCLLSNYTVASAQAIAQIKPNYVIAISTPKVKKEEGCFKIFLENSGIKYDIIGGLDSQSGLTHNSTIASPFPAGSPNHSRRWIDAYLVPFLKQKKEAGWRIHGNITGSTKGASIALHNCFAWDELHYTAEGSRTELEEILSDKVIHLAPLPMLSEIRLLGNEVKQIEDPWENEAGADLIAYCNIMHEDYKNPEKSIMLQNDKMFRDLWFKGSDEGKIKKDHGVTKHGDFWILPAGDASTFLGQFVELSSSIILLTDGTLQVPVDPKHAWVRFITGTWWEHLVAEWAKPHCQKALKNIAIGRSQGTDTETDILIRTNNNELRIIECKVEPPGETKLNEIYTKLKDSLDRFGKTDASLMISPVFFNRCKEGVEASFRDACNFRQIKILQTEAELKDWLAK